MMDKEQAVEVARPFVKQMMGDKLTDDQMELVVNIAAYIMYQALSTALALAAEMNGQQEAAQINQPESVDNGADGLENKN